MVGFQSAPRFASCLRRGGRSKFFGRLAWYGGRLLCTLQGGDQDQAPGGPEVVQRWGGDTFHAPGGCWETVCGTARSGIWVLKGDLRSRVLPVRNTHDTAWVTPWHDCLCSC